jgi:hypothetical protein
MSQTTSANDVSLTKHVCDIGYDAVRIVYVYSYAIDVFQELPRDT